MTPRTAAERESLALLACLPACLPACLLVFLPGETVSSKRYSFPRDNPKWQIDKQAEPWKRRGEFFFSLFFLFFKTTRTPPPFLFFFFSLDNRKKTKKGLGEDLRCQWCQRAPAAPWKGRKGGPALWASLVTAQDRIGPRPLPLDRAPVEPFFWRARLAPPERSTQAWTRAACGKPLPACLPACLPYQLGGKERLCRPRKFSVVVGSVIPLPIIRPATPAAQVASCMHAVSS